MRPHPPASSLQRVYAITFPDDKELKEYQHRMEEARKRDHRNVGTQQASRAGGLGVARMRCGPRGW